MLGNAMLVILAIAADPAAAGQVTAAAGSVQIHRGGQTFRAELGSAIQDGDLLQTGSSSGAGAILSNGQLVYLGPDTTAVLQGSATDRTLQLEQGEARAAIAGEGAITIATPTAQARLDRGILHASAGAQETRLWSEGGTAEVTSGDRLLARLGDGQQIAVPRDGSPRGPEPADGRGWSIRVNDLQLATAAASSRRHKGRRAIEVNDATAKALASGQLPELPGQAPPTTPEEAPPTPPTPAAPTPPTEAPPTTAPTTSTTQTNTTASTSAISLALGSVSGASGIGASGGLFSDAQQDSLNRTFPGNIHLVTAETGYTLGMVNLRPNDKFPTTREYWSIGLGTPPIQQVTTTFITGSAPVPITIPIPRTNAYLVQFPASQYGIPDPATNPEASGAQVGIAGLVGVRPISPQIQNATPLIDTRARFNDRATFALGEFALQRVGRHPLIDIRRSDQDRQIIKSGNGNDDQDQVTPNIPNVVFKDARDPKFFPELPTVKVPVSFSPAPTFSRLDLLRKAAVTTLLADQLSDFARRTGQTRFVLRDPNGTVRVVDISGFHRPGAHAQALRADLLRNGTGIDGRLANLRAGKHR